MILWRNTENYHFDSDPRFPPFLLYVRWKSGVTFVRRCFRDIAFDHTCIHTLLRGEMVDWIILTLGDFKATLAI